MKLGPVRKALSTVLLGRQATMTLEQFDQLVDATMNAHIGGVGGPSATGLDIVPDSALSVPTAWSCIDLISSVLATLPCKLYRRQERGRLEARDHPLYPVLHAMPNRRMTAVEFFSTGQLHLLTRGNFYAQIIRSKGGDVLELWPLHPDKVSVGLEMRGDKETGRLLYVYQKSATDKVALREVDVLHVRGLASDGVVGMSPVSANREAFALSLKAQEFGAAFLKNYARIPVYMKSPQKWTPDQKKQFADDWRRMYAGGNTGSTVILDNGLEPVTVGFSPEDAQYLELRQFQRGDVCAIFHVPPFMVSDGSNTSWFGTGIEQQFLGWLNTCIVPWTQRWTQRVHASLLTEDERDEISAEFVPAGILRGDITTRYNAHRTAITTGWMSRNEVRAIENLNPIDGLDDYMSPANMTNAGSQSERKPGDTEPR